MNADRIRSILIVGGGAPAWLAALTLARRLDRTFCEIRVLEATSGRRGPHAHTASPAFRRLLAALGLDELDLVRCTQATISLGAEFTDWGAPGETYFHPFGPLGARLQAVGFHHHWLRLRALGVSHPLGEYSIAAVAARHGRFAPPSTDPRSVLSLLAHGYHVDAEGLATYLRRHALARGVHPITADIVDVRVRGADGGIERLELADGTTAEADLYIDAGGAGDRLHTRAGLGPTIDWRAWLPCDRAWVARIAPSTPPPYSRFTAAPAGYRWELPLQHATEVGIAFSSAALPDDEALAALKRGHPETSLGDPRPMQLPAGRPTAFWSRNCVALAADGFGALEGTSLHLAQTAVTRLLALFPVRRVSPPDIAEYNRLTILEHERIRDFLAAHFHVTRRDDSPFWRACRTAAMPGTLRAKLDLFEESGRVALLDEEHFGEDSWLALLLGQGIVPERHDPLADVLDPDEVRSSFENMRTGLRDAVLGMPLHAEFIARHGAPRTTGGIR